MLLEEGRIGLLDWGSVGRLDATMRAAVGQLLSAVERDDPVAATDALLEIVPGPDEIDERALERAIGALMVRHLGGAAPAGVALFFDLLRVVSRFGLSLPPEVAAMFRALGTLEGTLVWLVPGFDIVGEARRFADDHLTVRTWAGSPQGLLRDELVTVLPMLRRVPRRLDRISWALEEGRFSVGVRPLGDERSRRSASYALAQLQLTVLAATAGLMAALLLGIRGGPEVTTDISLYELFGYLLLVISSILALRVLVVIFGRRA